MPGLSSAAELAGAFPVGSGMAIETAHRLRSTRKIVTELKQLDTVLTEYKASLITTVDRLSVRSEGNGFDHDVLERQRVRDAATFLVKSSFKPDEQNDQVAGNEDHQLQEKVQSSVDTIYSWFSRSHPGVINLMVSHLKGEESQELKKIVAAGVAHWYAAENGLAKAFRYDVRDQNGTVKFRTSRIEEAQLKNFVGFFLAKSHDFSLIKDRVIEGRFIKGKISLEGVGEPINEAADQNLTAENSIEAPLLEALVEEDVLNLDRDEATAELKAWVKDMADKARREGLKVYPTPFYQRRLERLDFISRKKNGVGGVILFGDPGSGKTELLIAKNAAQGFDSRVINIHYYTSFAELMAEKAVSIAGGPGSDTAKSIGAVLETFQRQSPQEFKDSCLDLFRQLCREGKLGDKPDFGRFMSHLILPEVLDQEAGEGGRLKAIEDHFAKNTYRNLTEEDWGVVQSAFLNTTRGRLLRTTLPRDYQESAGEVVLGEILSAITESRKVGGRKMRVILDEIDKAGPNSLGGILSFLAKSPGEIFEYGSERIMIPKWFKVDSSSNGLNLRDDFKSRFHTEKLEMPPAKDQLMIAAVLLSDGEGNVLLSPHEQHQLVGFFVYVLPQINEIMKKGGFPAVSNRDVQRLAGDLVDSSRLERTNISVSQAIRNMILEERILVKITPEGKKIDVTDNIEDCLSDLDSLFADSIKDDRVESVAYIENPLLLRLQGKTAKERQAEVTRIKEKTIRTPLYSAIEGLVSSSDLRSEPILRRCHLTEAERLTVNNYLVGLSNGFVDTGDINMDVISLPTGLAVSGERINDRLRIRIEAVREGELSNHILYSTSLAGERLAASSESGSVIVVMKNGEVKNQPWVWRLRENGYRGWECKNRSQGQEAELLSLPADSKVIMDKKGELVGFLDREKKQIFFYPKFYQSPTQIISQIEDCEISEDGKLLLLKKKNSQGRDVSVVHSTQSWTDKRILPEGEWKFAGSNLIVKTENTVDGRVQVGSEAYVITS